MIRALAYDRTMMLVFENLARLGLGLRLRLKRIGKKSQALATCHVLDLFIGVYWIRGISSIREAPLLFALYSVSNARNAGVLRAFSLGLLANEVRREGDLGRENPGISRTWNQ